MQVVDLRLVETGDGKSSPPTHHCRRDSNATSSKAVVGVIMGVCVCLDCNDCIILCYFECVVGVLSGRVDGWVEWSGVGGVSGCWLERKSDKKSLADSNQPKPTNKHEQLTNDV